MYESIKPISQGQMRMIYGLARKVNLDDELLHDMVRGQTGCEHIRSLSITQAKALIDRLKRVAGEPEKETPGDRATEAQRRMIYALAKELGWDHERLRAFMEKRFNASAVAFLTASKTKAVIEALKSIQAGGRGERR